MDMINILSLAAILIYVFIPIFIIINILGVSDVDFRKCRLKYAIPSIFVTVINLLLIIYVLITSNIEFLNFSKYIFLIPIILDLICIIFYKRGRGEEKKLEIIIAGREIDNARNIRNNSQIYTISFADEVEKL